MNFTSFALNSFWKEWIKQWKHSSLTFLQIVEGVIRRLEEIASWLRNSLKTGKTDFCISIYCFSLYQNKQKNEKWKIYNFNLSIHSLLHKETLSGCSGLFDLWFWVHSYSLSFSGASCHGTALEFVQRSLNLKWTVCNGRLAQEIICKTFSQIQA